MASSVVALGPRTYLFPSSLSGKSRYISQASGAPNANLSSKDSFLCPGRKGFSSEFGGLLPSPKGFHLRAFPAASSGCSRRMTYLLSYPRAIYERSYVGDLHGPVERNFRRYGKRDLSSRGLKRPLSACNHLYGESRSSCWNDENSFGKMPSKATPFAARKRVRCWNEESGGGEAPPSDTAALGELEQAIQFQVKEETRLFFGGPAKGDLAEIEAFCRLYRHAELLQSAVMDALRTHSTTANVESQMNIEPNRGDSSEVEEKVASGLAHLMALLREGKDDILGGRTIRTDSPGEEMLSSDNLRPFAQLRKDVRACCSTLEDALESLLPADNQPSLAARDRMVKLKNACLDAGFPRPEGVPSPADIPNLAPVRLRPSKSARTLYKDENVAFWRGGQVTEVGLSWLIEKGFKTIVDLREGSAPPIPRSPLPDAEGSGKIKVITMAVERGSTPSKEQVDEFARLVADTAKKPLYLHTRAGVHRASAMVSKWREVVLREQLQVGPVKAQVTSSPRTPSRDLELLSVGNDVTISPEDALALENATHVGQNGSLSLPEKASSDTFSTDSGSDQTVSGDEILTPAGIVQDGQANANGSVPSELRQIDVIKNAFEAQRPIKEILNKKAMSKFMKRRRFPSVLSSSRTGRPVADASMSSNRELGVLNGNIAGPANRWIPSRLGIPIAQPSEVNEREKQPADALNGPVDGGYDKAIATKNGNTRLESEAALEGNEQGDRGESRNKSFYTAGGEKNPTEEVEEPVAVEGDMCASTTGVVRLQSRKKAEMFLVRTDGYSCTRERVKESTLAFTHPSTQQQMLMWKTPPRTVLLLKKLGSELTKETEEVASFLHYEEGMDVMVEPDVHDRLARLQEFGFIQTFYNQDLTELHERIDFVVCLGGDGVILHASNLFRNAVPPVVSFNLGSLGFLTSHTFAGHKKDLQAVIHGHNDMMTGVYITLRMRLRCELYRNGRAVPGKVFDVLNEVVVDRGSSPYLCKIECYERNRLITKVQADGVIVATPTGSTAYSIAAGGSMVHPNVPCMLFTPICPHSLSFRPVILPDSALLELRVPNDARSNAWASFDGKRRQQLSKGDSVRICMSEHPLPTVNKSDQTDDWFQSLVRCLNWNERLEQRPLSP